MARLTAAMRRIDLKTLENILVKRRSEEGKKLQRLLARRKRLEAELAKLDRQLGSPSILGKKGKIGAAKTIIIRRPNARRMNKISLGDAIEKVMSARGKPIHYKELTTQIERRGLYKTKSRNLLSTVAVTLKRDKRFKKIEPGMYSLRKK
jgi:hypothetical protein